MNFARMHDDYLDYDAYMSRQERMCQDETDYESLGYFDPEDIEEDDAE